LFSKLGTKPSVGTLSVSVKSQPHKWHIWFFADTQANAKKPKEPFFANAPTDRRQYFNRFL